MVKSSERTLRMLKMVAQSHNGLTFTEIRDGLDIPKSSVFSLIRELLDNRYLIFSDVTKKYYAGIEFIKMSATCLEGTDLLREMQLLTSELGKELGQTTHASTLDGRSILYLAKYETNQGLSSMHAAGTRLPAHCTATGKVLLSRLTDEEIRESYGDQPMEMLTERSIHTMDALLEDIQVIRQRGYALEFGECRDFTACIAMPIFHDGKAIAGISVTYSIYALQTADKDHIASVIHRHKSHAEKRLIVW